MGCPVKVVDPSIDFEKWLKCLGMISALVTMLLGPAREFIWVGLAMTLVYMALLQLLFRGLVKPLGLPVYINWFWIAFDRGRAHKSVAQAHLRTEHDGLQALHAMPFWLLVAVSAWRILWS